MRERALREVKAKLRRPPAPRRVDLSHELLGKLHAERLMLLDAAFHKAVA